MNANQALLDYLNLPHEAMIGHAAQEFNLGLNLQSQQRAVLTTQLLKDGNIRNFEEEIELPSGKRKTVLTSIQYIYIEEMDDILSTFIDISERVQVEQKIRQLSIDLTTGYLRGDGIDVFFLSEFADVSIEEKVRTAIKLVVERR